MNILNLKLTPRQIVLNTSEAKIPWGPTIKIENNDIKLSLGTFAGLKQKTSFTIGQIKDFTNLTNILKAQVINIPIKNLPI